MIVVPPRHRGGTEGYQMIQPLPTSPASSLTIVLPASYVLITPTWIKGQASCHLHWPCTLSSSLSLEGFLYLVTYLSFKNQIKYYLLSDTVPTPQARIQVLWLCPQSMRCTERFWWYSEHPTVGSLNPMLWTYVESLLCTSYFRCKN